MNIVNLMDSTDFMNPLESTELANLIDSTDLANPIASTDLQNLKSFMDNANLIDSRNIMNLVNHDSISVHGHCDPMVFMNPVHEMGFSCFC